MKYLMGFLILGGLVGIGWFWWPSFSTRSAIVADTPVSATIIFPSGERLLADVADTHMERTQGLSGRTEPQALLFLFDRPAVQTFWMYEMLFSIDLLWLDQGVIVGMEQNMPLEDPAKTLYTSPKPVKTVLELPAGTIVDQQLTTGQRLDILLHSK